MDRVNLMSIVYCQVDSFVQFNSYENMYDGLLAFPKGKKPF